MDESLTLSPTANPRRFRDAAGKVYDAPDGWECLPPGDAGVTRKLKALGPTWTVVEKRGRKTFSRGVWAPAANVAAAKSAMDAVRADPAHAKKQASAVKRREAAQADYVEDFTASVRDFLRFSATYADLERRLAEAVSAHATPVGSGTVARTKRIPVEQRAESAVIAWLRHQTTAYDDMSIARVKGERRRVRQQLAATSRKLLDLHRRESSHPAPTCALCRAVPAVPAAESA